MPSTTSSVAIIAMATAVVRWRARASSTSVPRFLNLTGTYVPVAPVATIQPLLVGNARTGLIQANRRTRSIPAGVVQEGAPAEPAYDEPGEHRGHRPRQPEVGVGASRRPAACAARCRPAPRRSAKRSTTAAPARCRPATAGVVRLVGVPERGHVLEREPEVGDRDEPGAHVDARAVTQAVGRGHRHPPLPGAPDETRDREQRRGGGREACATTARCSSRSRATVSRLRPALASSSCPSTSPSRAKRGPSGGSWSAREAIDRRPVHSWPSHQRCPVSPRGLGTTPGHEGTSWECSRVDYGDNASRMPGGPRSRLDRAEPVGRTCRARGLGVVQERSPAHPTDQQAREHRTDGGIDPRPRRESSCRLSYRRVPVRGGVDMMGGTPYRPDRTRTRSTR